MMGENIKEYRNIAKIPSNTITRYKFRIKLTGGTILHKKIMRLIRKTDFIIKKITAK